MTKTATHATELDRRIRDALSSAKMSLWEFDLGSGILDWTGNVSKHFFDFAQSFDGSVTQYLNLIHEDDRAGVLEIIQQSEVGNSFFNQHRIKWPDGTYHWVEGIGNIVKSGDSIKLTGTVQDITDKKKIELEREDWRQKYELIAKSIRLVVYHYHHETGTIQWSGSTEELFGYKKTEISHIDAWEKNIHPDDLQYTLDAFERAEKNKEKVDIKYRYQVADGHYMYIHDKGVFIGEENIKMLGMITDISEIKESEEALFESERRFMSMIHDMNIGVGLYDKETKPLLCNRIAYELLGLTESQFLGKAAYDPGWRIVHRDGSEFKNENFPIPMAIKTGKPVRQSVMGVHRPTQKDFVWLLVDAEPIFDSSGQFLHVICTYSDITELRKIQDTLTEKNTILTTLADELKGKNERLLEFAQIVSHNLRSPISSIVSLLELFENSDDATQLEITQHIRNVSTKALLTIDELNQVLKIQQEDNISTANVDLNRLLDHTMDLQKGAVLDSGTEISRDFQIREIEYPPIYLESIFLNLLSNSLKYRAEERQCKVSVKSYHDEHGQVVLEWEDNGIGIDTAKHKNDLFKLGKIFHSNEDSRGVGLFLIKNQVDVMGGKIHVESKIGAWTKFKITFDKKKDEI